MTNIPNVMYQYFRTVTFVSFNQKFLLLKRENISILKYWHSKFGLFGSYTNIIDGIVLMIYILFEVVFKVQLKCLIERIYLFVRVVQDTIDLLFILLLKDKYIKQIPGASRKSYTL